ncbi:carbohydrate kinase family protein [Natronomonas marina]|uniref:carbohydrate kinase family protein n=1 Tax=Natronomonas marina TaxID=2961939 RepID=UPI0020C97B6A|nr:PfkB family carbohydrate kinase [Natronomonas marina]
MRVVCVGHVNWDVTLRVDRLPGPDDEARVHERREAGGGSAANVAAALAMLSREARLFGSVGADDPGSTVEATLREIGVETRLKTVEGAETTRKYLLVDDDGEVAVLGTEGANEAISGADVPASALADADALHLTGQSPGTAARLAAAAADHGLPVSFDPGRRLADREYGEVVERVDLLFVTDREAAEVHASVPWKVTKHGERGATLACPEGRFDHGGYGLPSVDSTGAGDAFAAGFLAAWLDDEGPERALAVANACGAVAASERGPRPDLSWERVEGVLS